MESCLTLWSVTGKGGNEGGRQPLSTWSCFGWGCFCCFPQFARIFLLHLMVRCVFPVFDFTFFPFFYLKSTFFFLYGLWEFAWRIVSLWQIRRGIDKATEEPLGKKPFWGGGRSFFLKGSLTDLHLPFLSCVLFSALRAELTIACRAGSQQHKPRFLHLFPSLLVRAPDPIKTSSLKISSCPVLSSQASTPSLGQKGKCCCFPLSRAPWRGSSSLKAKLPCLCCLAAERGWRKDHGGFWGTVVGKVIWNPSEPDGYCLEQVL